MEVRSERHMQLLYDDNTMDIIDTRTCVASQVSSIEEIIPEKITGTYTEDYNITYIDEIIRKKIKQEKFKHTKDLRLQYEKLRNLSLQPQTHIMRQKTLTSMEKLNTEIEEITSGKKLQTYDTKVCTILQEYKKFSGKIKTLVFNIEEPSTFTELDTQAKQRIHLITRYLDIASDYIQIDVIRIVNRPTDVCDGCGISLNRIVSSDEGSIRCPECFTEHSAVILTKLPKDSARINTSGSADDESIENFLRAFNRYQGFQSEQPDPSLYLKLDEYFIRHGRREGNYIKTLSLTSRGRRGDTDHQMLWTALSDIGESKHYEDANLIGHIYWGWTLPNVMHYKDVIIMHYTKTQKVFYQIPIEERCRSSSLGTQFRLWRHLQLVGHECYKDEFKIAGNSESIRTHNKLWKLMCEGCNDPSIYYID